MLSRVAAALLPARIASSAHASTSGRAASAACNGILGDDLTLEATSAAWSALHRLFGTQAQHHTSLTPAQRASSSTAAAAPSALVPVAISQELEEMERFLKRASDPDGRKRHRFSATELPFAIPSHTIEDGLPTFKAHVRTGAGSNFVKWLRMMGRMPARIYSFPSNQHIWLHLAQEDGDKILRKYGRNGCLAQPMRMDLVHADDPNVLLGSVRVKPQRVQVTSSTAKLENMDFLFLPPERIVHVHLPIKLINDDVAPGVRKGGWMWMPMRTVRYQCLGSSIPRHIELDVKALDLDQQVLVRNLPIPPGTRISVKNYDAPVVKCTTDLGKD